jgi:hypothetical protein
MGNNIDFSDKVTNANVLTIGQPLTEEQIRVLAEVEHQVTEWMWRDRPYCDAVEPILHAFICQALQSCVCRETRDLS